MRDPVREVLAELVACWQWWRDKKWSITPQGAERDYQERSAHERREYCAIAAARAALAQEPTAEDDLVRRLRNVNPTWPIGSLAGEAASAIAARDQRIAELEGEVDYWKCG